MVNFILTKAATALLSAQQSAEGTLGLLVFVIFLFMGLWGINIYRHYKSKNWTKFQKIVDFAGLAFFGILFIILIIPMIKGA